MGRIKLFGGRYIEIELPPPGLPIEEAVPPKNVILPLPDKGKRAYRPLVRKGEMVFKGERVAEDSNHLMPPIHSPVSGKVTYIKDVRYPEGANIPSLFIESDGQEKWKTTPVPCENFMEMAPEELMGAIRDAGVEIIPLDYISYHKRSIGANASIRHLVINGIGHGFGETIIRQLMLERSGDLLEGIKLARRIFQPEKIYLAIDKKHEDVIRSLMGNGLEKCAEMVKLDVYYPLGHPHLLFKRIFGKEIPSPHRNTIDMGAAFSNVDNILHALDAVKQGEPQLITYISVSGEGIRTPKNLKVHIGTPLKEIIDLCGGIKERPGRIVLGTPLDGSAQLSLESPVLKNTLWLWIQSKKSVVTDKYRSCIGCGDCVDICPVNLMPNLLGKFCEFGKYQEAADQYNLFTCIECGLCAYVCPSRRPIVHFIRLGKWELSLEEKENAGK
jgi:electron transport complex protein RnfC